MPSLKFPALSLDALVQFMDQVLSTGGSNTYLYVTIGDETPWANGDSTPDIPVDSVEQEFSVWRNMIGGKRVVASDMCPVIPRINWTANTAYTAYDETATNLFANITQFYVLTTDYNVYKCLYNNGGANSTAMPNSVQTNTPQTTLDGYIWKFMYQLSVSDQVRFLTPTWMPVHIVTINDGSLQYLAQQAAVDGGLNIILDTVGGQGYVNQAALQIIITGDGSGALAFANTNTTNSVVNVTVSNPGALYTYANAVVQDNSLSHPGTGAVLKVVIPPKGGHSFYAAKELGATSLMIDMRMKGAENGILETVNDLRQVAIVKNPLVYGSQNVSTNLVFSQALQLSVSGTGPGYQLDEIAYQGVSLPAATFVGTVLNWDSTNSVVTLTQTTGGLPNIGLLTGATSGAGRFIVATKTPDLQPYTGDLLYLDNITPIQRAPDQLEDYKIVLEF